jgi:hypothetical protein
MEGSLQDSLVTIFYAGEPVPSPDPLPVEASPLLVSPPTLVLQDITVVQTACGHSGILGLLFLLTIAMVLVHGASRRHDDHVVVAEAVPQPPKAEP